MKKFFLVLIGASLLSACSKEAMPYDQFAMCLKEKGVKMYGADTCPHCQEQKKLFKGSFGYVDYIECNQNPQECQKQEIQAYPTWEIDGKKVTGRKSLSELAELSGCSLTATPAETTDTES
jgi:glutaredoxin